ncbi:MAG: DUF3604 domain-containing protein, partial [Candidatus Coatesbacteria bacterium]
MRYRVLPTVAALLSFAAAAGAGEAKPWVKVKPDVLPAGSVVPRVTFEVKMPVAAPPGSVVEIQLPYHFGFPQTDDAAGDNYFSGQAPKGVRLELSAEVLDAGHYVIRAAIDQTPVEPGKKIKLFLDRERIQPFDQDERAFLTFLFGPADESGERPLLAEGQATVVRLPGGPPHHFRLVAPTCVVPGEPFAVKVAVLDEHNNLAGKPWKGKIALAGEGITGPAKASFGEKDGNYLQLDGYAVNAPGVYRLTVRGGELAGRSNPIICRETWNRRVFWGDEHGHSTFSDGMRPPEDYFDYGRYVALLDATFLTDHAENLVDDEWPLLVAAANAKNDAPAFVTMVAYEWTSDAWSGGYGHRCVFFREEGGPYYPCYDENADTPVELWGKYRPGGVITIPHHTLAGFRWSHFDAAFDRCVEIVSHWGCSEYEGNPFWENREWRGGGVVAALDSYYL